MELTPEDSLRLNVLLASGVQAIRIDEQNLVLHGLTPRGEANIPLHPEGRKESYLRLVRELLSGHALGSPGGFPIYLRNWTRSGQPMGDNLDKLLLLGEPEAVVSVAYSPKITAELARLAWWAMPVADNARRMLERPWVADSDIGKELAAFLIEHLPFESSPHVVMDTLRIVLHPGLIDGETRLRLWNKASRDNACYVPFLERLPDDLPVAVQAGRPVLLDALVAQGNPAAILLTRVFAAPGQAFLHAAAEAVSRPADQDVAVGAFNAIAAYFSALRPASPCTAIADLEESARRQLADSAAAQAVLGVAPELDEVLFALFVLAQMDAEIARPILSRTTAEGSLMRRKLEPVTQVLLRQIAVLRGKAG
ncbi:MAG: hypothetical protein KGZ83_18850 [Sulfuricella sp.]|nr:hypothetical protein [Sulfuricella sp.]